MSKLGSARKYKKQLIGLGLDKSIAKDYAKKYRKRLMSDKDMEFQVSSMQKIVSSRENNPRQIFKEIGDR